MHNYTFETEIAVRDYECDIQGIVNNANYLHYTEHTRHLFLQAAGLSFSGLHAHGIDPVVARMQLQFKASLHPDDIILSKLWIEKASLRYIFHHDLYRKSDGMLCHRAAVEIVSLINGRLGTSPLLDIPLAKYL